MQAHFAESNNYRVFFKRYVNKYPHDKSECKKKKKTNQISQSNGSNTDVCVP